jgi:hypothetical protein
MILTNVSRPVRSRIFSGGSAIRPFDYVDLFSHAAEAEATSQEKADASKTAFVG